MEISKMTLTDLDEIGDSLQTEFDEFWNSHILESELKKNETYYIVARIDGKIVGFAGILINIDIIEIMNIVVRKDNRNKGIGESLLRELIKISKDIKQNKILINLNMENFQLDKMTLEVNVKNIPARKLYKKLGFEEVRM